MSSHVISVKANMSAAHVKPRSGGSSQNNLVVWAKAYVRAANVKPRSGGRSQNYMPPEAKDALDKAAKAKAAAASPVK